MVAFLPFFTTESAEVNGSVFTTEETEKRGKYGMGLFVRAPERNPWPIIRFLAHSPSWTSNLLRLPSGEKPKSATLRAKE